MNAWSSRWDGNEGGRIPCAGDELRQKLAACERKISEPFRTQKAILVPRTRRTVWRMVIFSNHILFPLSYRHNFLSSKRAWFVSPAGPVLRNERYVGTGRENFSHLPALFVSLTCFGWIVFVSAFSFFLPRGLPWCNLIITLMRAKMSRFFFVYFWFDFTHRIWWNVGPGRRSSNVFARLMML